MISVATVLPDGSLGKNQCSSLPANRIAIRSGTTMPDRANALDLSEESWCFAVAIQRKRLARANRKRMTAAAISAIPFAREWLTRTRPATPANPAASANPIDEAIDELNNDRHLSRTAISQALAIKSAAAGIAGRM